MFTQPCFIQKNTSLLINSLEKLGYRKNSPYWTDKCSIVWCYQYSKEKGFDTPHYVIADSFDIPFDKNSSLCGRFIDCGTNEDLFLAMAALRDDTDKNQWFVYDDKDDNPDERQILWFICEKDDIRHDMWHDQAYLDCHKATVQELIQHFKDK